MTILRVRTQILNASVGQSLSTFFFDPAAGTAQDAADAVTAFWNTVRGVMANYSVINVLPEVHSVNEVNGQVTAVTSVTPSTQSGAEAGDQLPSMAQGLIRLKTNTFVGGREIQGRLFIPGANESSNTGTRPTAAYKLALDTAAANLIADANSHWVVWSRTNGADYGVTNGVTWGEWAVLRSRRD